MNLQVIPPDINHSRYQFTVTDDHNIVYGLGAIKGVGEGAIEHLTLEREASGPFQSLNDLCMRLDLQKFNRRCLEAVLRAGALDKFKHTRATLMHYLPRALQLAEQHQAQRRYWSKRYVWWRADHCARGWHGRKRRMGY